MFSVTRSAEADVSAVAMMRMIRDLHLDQWTTAPWWPATAVTANRLGLQLQPFKCCVCLVCAWLQIRAWSFADTNVINVRVRLQGEYQADDVGNWQEGRHGEHQRPDESDSTITKREVTMPNWNPWNPQVLWELSALSSNVTHATATKRCCTIIHVISLLQEELNPEVFAACVQAGNLKTSEIMGGAA